MPDAVENLFSQFRLRIKRLQESSNSFVLRQCSLNTLNPAQHGKLNLE